MAREKEGTGARPGRITSGKRTALTGDENEGTTVGPAASAQPDVKLPQPRRDGRKGPQGCVARSDALTRIRLQIPCAIGREVRRPLRLSLHRAHAGGALP